MEKTQIPEVTPVNGGHTCSYCRHLDTAERVPLCRRFPPQVTGSALLMQPPGAMEPQPIIIQEGYWPRIGKPELHWCGEYAPK
jgi:hypothetical protein